MEPFLVLEKILTKGLLSAKTWASGAPAIYIAQSRLLVLQDLIVDSIALLLLLLDYATAFDDSGSGPWVKSCSSPVLCVST